MKNKEKKHSHLFYDIMYPLWNLYHRYILHFRGWSAFLGCGHINPYDVLTPRRLRRQIENIKKLTISNYETQKP